MQTLRHPALIALLLATISDAAAAVGTIKGDFSVTDGGGATYTIPISIPPGTAGLEPQLGIQYSSQGGNGLLGVGAGLSGLSTITRCPPTLVNDNSIRALRFDASDRFCMDGQRLQPLNGSYHGVGAQYRTEMESFSKIAAFGGTITDPAYFVVRTKSGLIMEYGATSDSRVEASGRTQAVAWALNRVQDTSGNYFVVGYQENTALGEHYPVSVDYTGNLNSGLIPYNEIQFVYQDRPDVSERYMAGSVYTQTKRLTQVRLLVASQQVGSYNFTYISTGAARRSKLTSVTECRRNECLPPTEFEWPALTASVSFQAALATDVQAWSDDTVRNMAMDLNGDGRSDFLTYHAPFNNTRWNIQYAAQGSGFEPAVSTSVPSWSSKNVNNAEAGDFDGDGKIDLLTWHVPFNNNRYNLHLNSGDGFNQAASTDISSHGDSNLRNIVSDFNGDGRDDYLVWHAPFNNLRWNLYLSEGSHFKPAVATNVQSHSSNRRNSYEVGDFNGDGLVDLLMWHAPFSNHRFNLYLNNGNGFDPAIATPIEAHDDSSLRSVAADFTGDGLTDALVWHAPFSNNLWNLYVSTGAGFLPAKPTIMNAASGSDVVSRIAGDFNGDGLLDLATYHAPFQNFRYNVYLNRGNGEFLPVIQTDIPSHASKSVPNVSGDFNGDGQTDLLIWHRPFQNNRYNLYRAIGVEPEQVTRIVNGLGAEVRIAYKPLTDRSVYTKGSGGAYPDIDIQSTTSVVAEQLSSTGIGGYRRVSYRYEGARANLNGRGQLGFQKRVVEDDSTGIQEITLYRQNHPYIGAPYHVTRKTLSGKPISETSTTHASIVLGPLAARRYFAYAALSKNWAHEINVPGGPVTTTVTEETYEEPANAFYGNLTRSKVSIYAGSETSGSVPFVTEVVNQYVPANESAWLLGRLSRTQVTRSGPDGIIRPGCRRSSTTQQAA